MSDRTIARFSKNRREEVRVGLDEFNGHRLVTVRAWVIGGGKDGGSIPTKNGLALRVAQLPQLIAALAVVEKEARSAGLLTDDAAGGGDG